MSRAQSQLLTCTDAPERSTGVTTIPTRRSGSVRVLVGMIHGYQAARSGRPTGCRYLPSCSEYAVEAIETHGPARGTALAARRIARCTPWGGHGVDPVPDRRAP
jgi:putative membrane protein insertion efficiency factor